jgi:hypothetical protein
VPGQRVAGHVAGQLTTAVATPSQLRHRPQRAARSFFDETMQVGQPARGNQLVDDRPVGALAADDQNAPLHPVHSLG